MPQRPLFWSIQGAWLFYLCAAVALAVFGYGLGCRVRVWLSGTRGRGPVPQGALSRLLVDGLLGRRIFRGDWAAGIMHALIFWGFAGLTIATALAAVDHYLVGFLQGRLYLVFSLGADIAGVILLVGLLWALFRRYLQRVARLERRPGDALVLLWLLLAALSGYLVEGLRLAVVRPPSADWSFAGYAVARLLSDPHSAAAAYPIAWWGHALLSLGLIAAIPFTKLFHALATPVGVTLAPEPARALRTDERGESDPAWSRRERVLLDACTRCGRCVDACPSTSAGEPFSPRALIVGTRDDLWRLPETPRALQWLARQSEGSTAWYCTTCRACLEVCPVYLPAPEIARELRRRLVEDGTRVPAALGQALDKLYKYGNPWEASKKKRGLWSKGLGLADLSREKADGRLCYFVGCTTAIDTRAQGLARAFVQILEHAALPFGTLSKKEPCCGDIARRVGEDGLFEEQMETCQTLLERRGIEQLVTSSPHCAFALRHDYARFAEGGSGSEGEREREGERGSEQTGVRARHYTELLDELNAAGSLDLARRVEATVTFHDPCYLGRHAGVYEAPRRVICAIPGVTLVEMAEHGPEARCCGGGGGRMWQEELADQGSLGERRVRQAAETGAQMLVTACPLCLIMLSDACKTAGLEDSLEIVDLNELVVRALPDESAGE